MSSFNNQVSIEDLPRVADVDFKALPKRAVYLGVINLSILFLVLIFVISWFVILGSGFFKEYGRYIYIGLISLYILMLVYHIIGFKYHKYAMRMKDIIYQEGYLWRRITTVPFNRIQHCEVTQGPIHRIMNVSKIKVFTAGGSSSDLAISGLSTEEAHKMKNFILAKTTSDEEE